MKNLFHNKRIRHFFIVDGSYLLFNLIYCLVFKYDFITIHTSINITLYYFFIVYVMLAIYKNNLIFSTK